MIHAPIQKQIDKPLLIVTPPSAVGYANGIAQSIVSLARCLGPVIGGYVSWNCVFQFCFTEVKLCFVAVGYQC